MEHHKFINKMLKDKYGCVSDGRPRFRIIFSGTETEKRFGTFEKYYGSIYLGEETGVKEVKKYEAVLKAIGFQEEYWVLEELEFGYNPELNASEAGHYEVRWIFNEKGKYQKPIWEAVEFLVECRLAPVQKETAAGAAIRENLKSEAYIKKMVEYFDDSPEFSFKPGGGSVSFANLDGRPNG